MSALPHLTLQGSSGRIVALQDLDGALLVALLDPPPPLQFGLDSDASCLSSSVVAFSICVLVSILAARMSCVL